MLRCKDLEVETWNAETIQAKEQRCGQKGSHTQVAKAVSFPETLKCEYFEGETQEITRQLAEALIRDGILSGS